MVQIASEFTLLVVDVVLHHVILWRLYVGAPNIEYIEVTRGGWEMATDRIM